MFTISIVGLFLVFYDDYFRDIGIFPQILLLWIFLYGVLSINPGFHRKIHLMVFIFSILPYIISSLLIKLIGEDESTILRILITINIFSLYIIYPLLISIAAFINSFEEKLGLIEWGNITQKRKNFFIIIVSLFSLPFIIEILVFIRMQSSFESDLHTSVLIYSFIFFSYFFIKMLSELLPIKVGELRGMKQINQITNHIIFLFVVIIYIAFLIEVIQPYMGIRDRFGDIVWAKQYCFVLFMGFVIPRYLVGIMREYRPTFVIATTTIAIQGIFAIYLYNLSLDRLFQ